MSSNMKIVVKSKDANINLRIPNRLISNSLVLAVAEKALKKQDTVKLTMDKDVRQNILKVMKQFNKEYKGLELVDIVTAEGEIVKIIW